MRGWTRVVDLAGQSGAAVAPVCDRWLEGVAPVFDRWLEGAGGILDTVWSRQGQVGGLLAVHDPNDAADPNDPFGDFVYTYDANGNVGQVVNWSADPNTPAAALVARYQYDPYGNRINYDPNDPDDYDQPFRFSTKQFDPETGLSYFGARYYDPRTGRWTGHDPKGEIGSANLYAAVRNAPLNWVDPDGAEEKPSGQGVPPPPPPPPATGPATQPGQDRSKACCIYSNTLTYTDPPQRVVSLPTCYKTEKCPAGASSPSQCCKCACSKRVFGLSRDRWLHESRWGACCMCTVSFWSQPWSLQQPHAELTISCPAYEGRPATTWLLGQEWPKGSPVWGQSRITLREGQSALPEIHFQKEIPCWEGHELIDRLKAEYPRSADPRNPVGDTRLYIWLVKQCRTLAWGWYKEAGEGMVPCGD